MILRTMVDGYISIDSIHPHVFMYVAGSAEEHMKPRFRRRNMQITVNVIISSENPLYEAEW